MNPFILTRIYEILTVDDELFFGIVGGITERTVTLQLTTDSVFFFTNDVVTIPINQIIVFHEVPQDSELPTGRRFGGRRWQKPG